MSSSIDSQLQLLRARYEKHNQSHVFDHIKELGPAEKQQLWSDLTHLKVEEVSVNFETVLKQEAEQKHEAELNLKQLKEEKKAKIQPFPFDSISDSAKLTREQLDNYYKTGLNAIAKGELGIVLM